MSQWAEGQYYLVGDQVVVGGSSPYTCVLANTATQANKPPNATYWTATTPGTAGVASVNTLTGSVGIVAGTGITVSTTSPNITISSSGVGFVTNPFAGQVSGGNQNLIDLNNVATKTITGVNGGGLDTLSVVANTVAVGSATLNGITQANITTTNTTNLQSSGTSINVLDDLILTTKNITQTTGTITTNAVVTPAVGGVTTTTLNPTTSLSVTAPTTTFNGNNITGVGNINLTTINNSVYPPVVPSGTAIITKYTTAGTYQYTVPGTNNSLVRLEVYMIGAGGGGAGGGTNVGVDSAGGGGGGSGYMTYISNGSVGSGTQTLPPLYAVGGSVITVVIGAGGAGGGIQTSGSDGSDTTIQPLNRDTSQVPAPTNVFLFTASGGKGGSVGTGGVGGSGGSGGFGGGGGSGSVTAGTGGAGQYLDGGNGGLSTVAGVFGGSGAGFPGGNGGQTTTGFGDSGGGGGGGSLAGAGGGASGGVVFAGLSAVGYGAGGGGGGAIRVNGSRGDGGFGASGAVIFTAYP